MSDEKRIAQLLVKLVYQDLSKEEEEELDGWRKASVANEEFVQEVTQQEVIMADLEILINMDRDALQRKIDAGMEEYPIHSAPQPKPLFYRSLPYLAAAIFIGCLVLVYLWPASDKKMANPLASTGTDSFFLKKIPSSGMVNLTLDDGSVVYLDEMKDSALPRQGGVQPSVGVDNRLLSYSFPSSVSEGIRCNILTVPYGNRYRLRLSDGTKVAMDVGASLRYPVVFTGDTREVELNGKAYFDVATDPKHPFIVKTKRQRVEVLGTSFDVEDYFNQEQSNVLVESGRVKVQSRKNTTILNPAQRARIDEKGVIRVDSVTDLKEELAWKEDYFDFDGLDIKAALWKLARSYRMHVLFEGNIKSGSLGQGYIQRDLPLDRLLKDLELPDLHFEIRMQDSTIIVKR